MINKAFLLLVAAAASSFGAQISFSHTTPNSTTPFTDPFSLSKFDPALGTLTGILIDFSATEYATVSVFNFTGINQAFTNGTASVPLVLTSPSGPVSVTAVAGPLAGTVAPGTVASFPGATGTVIAPTLNVAAAMFGLYTGTGGTTLSFNVSGSNGTYSGSAAPGVFFGGSASAGGVTTITYNYTTALTSTPEPATMSLFGSALFGLSLMKLRSRKN